MRTITVNTSQIKKHKTKIDYSSITEEILEDTLNVERTYVVTCKGYHGLTDTSTIYVCLDEGVCHYLPIEKSVSVTIVDKKTFKIKLPKYESILVENVLEDLKGNAILDVVNANIYSYIRNHESINLNYQADDIHAYINISEEDAMDDTLKLLICDKQLNFREGYVNLYVDWYLNRDDDSINRNITFKYSYGSVSIPVQLGIDNILKVNDEQTIVNDHLDSIIESVIPETIDYERRQFVPVYRERRRYLHIKNIKFNLHFRDRFQDDGKTVTNGWVTSDEKYWNYMTKLEGGNINTEADDILRYNINEYDDFLGDELNCLGFIEDDIRFSKNKLKKSFLRLLFYSSKQLLSKELLGYATVYFDMNQIFKKYITIKSKGLDTFDKNRTDESLRLSASFNIRDKFNASYSSEGFYLYLFPSEISKENTSRTIYMKVEFNHAGYGKTIPMMLPRKDDSNEGFGNIIDSSDTKFPKNFLTKDIINNSIDTDFEKYQNYTMIPLQIFYDKTLNEYVYTFPFNANKGDEIILNLFEPRINGFETSGNN